VSRSGTTSVTGRHTPGWMITTWGLPIVLCATWAFWPLSKRPHDMPARPAEQTTPRASSTNAPALDLAVFSKMIWPSNPLLVKQDSQAQSPPTPPLRCQLLAITHQAPGVFTALIFDPDVDRILWVAAGDELAGRTVISIAATSVQLRGPTGDSETMSLALASESTGGRP
jgi:hypothetical protein